MPDDFDAKLDRLIDMNELKKNMEDNLKPVAAEVEALRFELAREFENRGYDSMKRKGRNLILSHELSIKCKDAQALVDIILESGDPGLAAIVTPQPQKLAAAVREMLVDPETGARIVALSQLPEAWRPHIDLTEFSRISIRKA